MKKNKIEKNKFNDKSCFLCGINLNKKNRTKEHVIPTWLQKRYNLWDQKLTLLNGTEIPYRYLTIPCCLTCNRKYLKPLEDKIKKAVDEGYNFLKKIDKEILFLWLGKIYFGLMYKELFLYYDQKDSNKGTITTPEYIKSFYSHYMFLQGVRGLHKFRDFFPASIYIVNTQSPKEKEEQWDFFDSQAMLIACRLGKIGIISVLQDGGITQKLEKNLSEYFSIPLHPIQFRELIAKILYKTILINRTPKYISCEKDKYIETIQLPIMGLSNKPIFDNWDNNVYAKILSQLTNTPIKITNSNPKKTWTYMVDKNRKPIFLDINKKTGNSKLNH